MKRSFNLLPKLHRMIGGPVIGMGGEPASAKCH